MKSILEIRSTISLYTGHVEAFQAMQKNSEYRLEDENILFNPH